MNEDIFMMFDKMPDAVPLFQAVDRRITQAFPDAKRKVSKTQVGYTNRYGFAYVWPPNRRVKNRPDVCVVLTFGLGYRVDHPRILESVEPYPGRWTHHVLISSADDMDGLIMDWLREAYDFSMNK